MDERPSPGHRAPTLLLAALVAVLTLLPAIPPGMARGVAHAAPVDQPCLAVGWWAAARLAYDERARLGGPSGSLGYLADDAGRQAAIAALAPGLGAADRLALAQFVEFAEGRGPRLDAAAHRRVEALIGSLHCDASRIAAPPEPEHVKIAASKARQAKAAKRVTDMAVSVMAAVAIAAAVVLCFFLPRIYRRERRHTRYDCPGPVGLTIGGARIPGRLVEISISGCKIECSDLPDPGTALELHIASINQGATCVWSARGMAGFAFDQNFSRRALSALRKEIAGAAPAAPPAAGPEPA